MTNHLANAKSSYLLQHKDNPVDWHEWGADAFDEARRRNVPVLLSVGYASCHWCHVMAHESFEDRKTADLINREFVPIKVDREERPDVDATYMAATQALTGQGGWPMTCFLDHRARPFYAGTYFPPTARGGLPAFTQVLTAVAEAWRRDPDQVAAAAGRIADHLREGVRGVLPAMTGGPAVSGGTGPAAAGLLGPAELDAARAALLGGFDPGNGGFGGAPKFPPALDMEFLLRAFERTGDRATLGAVTLTLEKMARGGIYDQLAGGFARYSVDATWHTPHFEKMLDDNALLLRLYAHHARLTASSLSARIATETADFMIREMVCATGAFITSLDADSAGVEGGTYRWPLGELVAALRAIPETGDPAAPAAAGLTAPIDEVLTTFGVDPARPDPEGEILRLVSDPDDPERFHAVRAALLAIRDRRPQPGRDEMATVRGNGLAITALAEAGAAFGRDDWIAAAARAADDIERTCRRSDGWRHSAFRGDPTKAPATLADRSCFATALLALYQAGGPAPRLTAAQEILAETMGLFRADDGIWFDVAAEAAAAEADETGAAGTGGVGAGAVDAGAVDAGAAAAGVMGVGGAPTGTGDIEIFQDGPAITRPRDPTDGVAPSGLSSAAEAYLTASALTGSGRWRDAAEQIAASVAGLAVKFPRAAGWHLAVEETMTAGPLQVAVAGAPGELRDELERTARRHLPGGAVIDVGRPDEPGRPLLADRPDIDGAPAVYVCRGFVCDRPVGTTDEVVRALRATYVISDGTSESTA